jgi:hypothetical protein
MVHSSARYQGAAHSGDAPNVPLKFRRFELINAVLVNEWDAGNPEGSQSSGQ